MLTLPYKKIKNHQKKYETSTEINKIFGFLFSTEYLIYFCTIFSIFNMRKWTIFDLFRKWQPVLTEYFFLISEGIFLIFFTFLHIFSEFMLNFWANIMFFLGIFLTFYTEQFIFFSGKSIYLYGFFLQKKWIISTFFIIFLYGKISTEILPF